jgi:hypothetical protein
MRYPAETDLRSYDAELGWLHAVAASLRRHHDAYSARPVPARGPRRSPEWTGDPVPLRHHDIIRQRLADVLALAAPFTG